MERDKGETRGEGVAEDGLGLAGWSQGKAFPFAGLLKRGVRVCDSSGSRSADANDVGGSVGAYYEVERVGIAENPELARQEKEAFLRGGSKN